MTVTAENVYSGPFYPNGVTTVFPFTFEVSGEDEVVVEIADVTVASSLYFVTLNDNGTGSVTFYVAPTGANLYLLSDPAFGQEAQFQNQGPYFQKTVENALDRLAQGALWLRDRSNRAIVAPIGEALSALPALASRKGKYLMFDAVTGHPKMDDPQNFAAPASAQADRSENEADRALTFANSASAAVIAAAIGAGVFNDAAAGLAATAEGGTFRAYTGTGVGFFRKTAGLAVLLKEIYQGLPSLPSRLALELTTPDDAILAVQLQGYDEPGDGGDAIYRRVPYEPLTERGKIQDDGGDWWELVPCDVLRLKQFGGVEGTDITDALKYMIHFGLYGRAINVGSEAVPVWSHKNAWPVDMLIDVAEGTISQQIQIGYGDAYKGGRLFGMGTPYRGNSDVHMGTALYSTVTTTSTFNVQGTRNGAIGNFALIGPAFELLKAQFLTPIFVDETTAPLDESWWDDHFRSLGMEPNKRYNPVAGITVDLYRTTSGTATAVAALLANTPYKRGDIMFRSGNVYIAKNDGTSVSVGTFTPAGTSDVVHGDITWRYLGVYNSGNASQFQAPVLPAYPAWLGSSPGFGANQSGVLKRHDMIVSGFEYAFAVQPCDYDGNGDWMPNLGFFDIEYCKMGIGVGNSQARLIDAGRCRFRYAHTLMNSTRLGQRAGNLGGHHANIGVAAFAVQLFEFGSLSTRPVVLTGVEAEAIHMIGTLTGSISTGESLLKIEGTINYRHTAARGVPRYVLKGTTRALIEISGDMDSMDFCAFEPNNVDVSGLTVKRSSNAAAVTKQYHRRALNACRHIGLGPLSDMTLEGLGNQPFDLDLADLGSFGVVGKGRNTARNITLPTRLRRGFTANGFEWTKGGELVKTQGAGSHADATYDAVTGVLTFTNVDLTNYDRGMREGYLPGSIVRIDGMGFFIFSADLGTKVTKAKIASNYYDAGADNFAMLKSYTNAALQALSWYYEPSGFYSPKIPLFGKFTSGSADITALVGQGLSSASPPADAAALAAATGVTALDNIADECLSEDPLDGSTGCKINALAVGPLKFTLDATADATTESLRLPLFIRAAPANEATP